MHGYGEFICGEGKYYIGNHSNDRKNGFGIYFNNTQMKAFIGFWSEGKKNGVGKCLEKGKQSKFALFNRGTLVKWLINEKETLTALKSLSEVNLNLLKLELPELIKFIFK